MRYLIRNKHCKEFDCFASKNGKCTLLEETYPYHENCPFYKQRTDLDVERAADIQSYRYAVKHINDLHDEFLNARDHLEDVKRRLAEARNYKSRIKTRIKKRMREGGKL